MNCDYTLPAVDVDPWFEGQENGWYPAANGDWLLLIDGRAYVWNGRDPRLEMRRVLELPVHDR